MKSLKGLTPQERQEFREWVSLAMNPLIPHDTDYILLVIDRDTGLTEWMSSRPDAMRILDTLIQQRKAAP